MPISGVIKIAGTLRRRQRLAISRVGIGAAIVDAGYDVVKMEPSTQLVEEIKAASKSAKK